MTTTLKERKQTQLRKQILDVNKMESILCNYKAFLLDLYQSENGGQKEIKVKC